MIRLRKNLILILKLQLPVCLKNLISVNQDIMTILKENHVIKR